MFIFTFDSRPLVDFDWIPFQRLSLFTSTLTSTLFHISDCHFLLPHWLRLYSISATVTFYFHIDFDCIPYQRLSLFIITSTLTSTAFLFSDCHYLLFSPQSFRFFPFSSCGENLAFSLRLQRFPGPFPAVVRPSFYLEAGLFYRLAFCVRLSTRPFFFIRVSFSPLSTFYRDGSLLRLASRSSRTF